MIADIAEAFQATALSGSLLLAMAVAAAAGLVAFLSPCVLPVVPGYLGYVSGLGGQSAVVAAGSGPSARSSRRGSGNRTARVSSATRGSEQGRMVLGAALFIAGFTVVFMILGGFAGTVGYLLQAHMVWVNRIAGAVVILMGLVFLGLVPALSMPRGTSRRSDAGLLGAPLMGMVFGLSWTPCIGPTYAAILALSLDAGADGGAALRGAILSLAYSLGLGLPFVLFALLFERALRLSRLLAEHRRAIGIFSGALLIGIGVLLITGLWSDWMGRLSVMISGFEPVV